MRETLLTGLMLTLVACSGENTGGTSGTSGTGSDGGTGGNGSAITSPSMLRLESDSGQSDDNITNADVTTLTVMSSVTASVTIVAMSEDPTQENITRTVDIGANESQTVTLVNLDGSFLSQGVWTFTAKIKDTKVAEQVVVIDRTPPREPQIEVNGASMTTTNDTNIIGTQVQINSDGFILQGEPNTRFTLDIVDLENNTIVKSFSDDFGSTGAVKTKGLGDALLVSGMYQADITVNDVAGNRARYTKTLTVTHTQGSDKFKVTLDENSDTGTKGDNKTNAAQITLIFEGSDGVVTLLHTDTSGKNTALGSVAIVNGVGRFVIADGVASQEGPHSINAVRGSFLVPFEYEIDRSFFVSSLRINNDQDLLGSAKNVNDNGFILVAPDAVSASYTLTKTGENRDVTSGLFVRDARDSFISGGLMLQTPLDIGEYRVTVIAADLFANEKRETFTLIVESQSALGVMLSDETNLGSVNDTITSSERLKIVISGTDGIAQIKVTNTSGTFLDSTDVTIEDGVAYYTVMSLVGSGLSEGIYEVTATQNIKGTLRTATTNITIKRTPPSLPQSVSITDDTDLNGESSNIIDRGFSFVLSSGVDLTYSIVSQEGGMLILANQSPANKIFNDESKATVTINTGSLPINTLAKGTYNLLVSLSDASSGALITQSYSFTVDQDKTALMLSLSDSTDTGIKGDNLTNSKRPEFIIEGKNDTYATITLTKYRDENIDQSASSYSDRVVIEDGKAVFSPQSDLTEGHWRATLTEELPAGSTTNIPRMVSIDIVTDYTILPLTQSVNVPKIKGKETLKGTFQEVNAGFVFAAQAGLTIEYSLVGYRDNSVIEPFIILANTKETISSSAVDTMVLETGELSLDRSVLEYTSVALIVRVSDDAGNASDRVTYDVTLTDASSNLPESMDSSVIVLYQEGTRPVDETSYFTNDAMFTVQLNSTANTEITGVARKLDQNSQTIVTYRFAQNLVTSSDGRGEITFAQDPELSDGTWQITATVGESDYVASVMVDTIKPDAPEVVIQGDSDLVGTSDNIIAKGFAFTTEEGAMLRYSLFREMSTNALISSQIEVDGNGMAQSGGQLKENGLDKLTSGTYRLELFATDRAGNKGLYNAYVTVVESEEQGISGTTTLMLAEGDDSFTATQRNILLNGFKIKSDPSDYIDFKIISSQGDTVLMSQFNIDSTGEIHIGMIVLEDGASLTPGDYTIKLEITDVYGRATRVIEQGLEVIAPRGGLIDAYDSNIKGDGITNNIINATIQEQVRFFFGTREVNQEVRPFYQQNKDGASKVYLPTQTSDNYGDLTLAIDYTTFADSVPYIVGVEAQDGRHHHFVVTVDKSVKVRVTVNGYDDKKVSPQETAERGFTFICEPNAVIDYRFFDVYGELLLQQQNLKTNPEGTIDTGSLKALGDGQKIADGYILLVTVADLAGNKITTTIRYDAPKTRLSNQAKDDSDTNENWSASADSNGIDNIDNIDNSEDVSASLTEHSRLFDDLLWQ